MLDKGNFYNTLIATRGDSEELQKKMEETVQKFSGNETNMNKPGMLLGKIQGGKTRAFIGIIALSFDNDYDMAIILTKGTKALARQTFARLKKDFRNFINDEEDFATLFQYFWYRLRGARHCAEPCGIMEAIRDGARIGRQI